MTPAPITPSLCDTSLRFCLCACLTFPIPKSRPIHVSRQRIIPPICVRAMHGISCVPRSTFHVPHPVFRDLSRRLSYPIHHPNPTTGPYPFHDPIAMIPNAIFFAIFFFLPYLIPCPPISWACWLGTSLHYTTLLIPFIALSNLALLRFV